MAEILAEHVARKYRKLAVYTLAIASLAASMAVLGGCSHGKLGNPFASKPFVPTAVPRDFAVVIDQNRATYFARQQIHQVVTASDMLSRTTYTTFSDYRNTVASHYTTVSPVTRSQLQNMWNEVRRHHLLRGAFTWYYWKSSSNRYHQDRMSMQIRANGRERVYHQLNHWDSNKAGLALDCQAVRFPVTQNAPAQYAPATTVPAGGAPAHAGGGNSRQSGNNTGGSDAGSGGNGGSGSGANAGASSGSGKTQTNTAPNIFPTPPAIHATAPAANLPPGGATSQPAGGAAAGAHTHTPPSKAAGAGG